MDQFPEHLVLFDGVCALCNGTVRFFLKRDRDEILIFAPLQGETAEQIERELDVNLSDLNTIVYVRRVGEEYELYRRSTAVLKIFRDLGGPWSLLGWFIFVPRFIRDAIYRFIARNRYRWFGRYDSCPRPDPESSDRVFD